MQAVLGSGALEGRWYQVGSWANANAGHAFCNSVGGFAPISRMANVQSIYGDLPGLRSPYTYWSGFKKSNEGGWRVFQSANGNTDVRKSLTWCEGDTRGSDDKCARAHPEDGCFKSKKCYHESFFANSLCLKTTPPYEIAVDSVADAFATFVTFSDAAGHGCYCAALANDEPGIGGAADLTDTICKQWYAARKCTQDAGGACAAETDLSYIWTSDCRSNEDPCKEALCDMDRQFAAQLNAQSGASLTSIDRGTDCIPSGNNPGLDSCCVAANPWESMRYNSNIHDCVSGVIVDI